MQGRSDDQRELLDAESVAGHLLKPESVFGFLAAHRGELFPEEMFADLFPSRRGRPSVPAEVMASVITLQALHSLSDNETVDAVTFDLRWKAACGLPITAAAFHSTTLTYWRRRLAASDRPNRIFEAVKAVVAATGVLAGKTRRALDSTVLDDAVATQDTVTQLIAAIRRVRREIPAAAAVIEQHCTAHDYDDPGKPTIAWNDKAARDQLVDALVGDAHRLLGHLPDQDLGPRAAEAVALLALVAGQDVEPVEGSDGTDGQWRIARQVVPDRVISTVDPDTRHAHKTVHRRQDGFKAHIAVEPDTGIITDCALTKANGPDNHEAVVGLALLDDEQAPVRVFGDAAYGTGAARAALADREHGAVIKPIPLRTPVPGGFTSDDFSIDFDARTVTCPAEHTVAITPSGGAQFEKHCRACPLRTQCTTAKHGRKLTISEHEHHLRAARALARTPEWQAEYRRHRPMVERSIAWLTRGSRKVRYRGVAKNDHWLHHRTAALNLRRLLTMGLTHTGTTWALA
ncbi:transposase, IS4 family [Mycobacterium parascrofulaceum ATCC BAA-614]|uniref:Transposase, IS4 family n=1 Tax=Mycobacterium parascrofulaceum ATCC BAA-614 TaxID=525368 RepID=D5PDX4_9MYCO|nr:IS1182 family transposase [Mycobacterium parascrofulaceum]EFG75725.1 transposase, IS4 family [Mycobacterium parascrofulaceum ATCC BAA-614]